MRRRKGEEKVAGWWEKYAAAYGIFYCNAAQQMEQHWRSKNTNTSKDHLRLTRHYQGALELRVLGFSAPKTLFFWPKKWKH